MSAATGGVTPSDVLRYTSPTKEFLCPLSANVYGIDFLAFKIRDMDTRQVVFEISKDPSATVPDYPEDFDYDQLRTIAYKFPASFLRFRTVGTTLRFRVGPKEVKDFRMIERHYFKGRLIKSYDFNFEFCIPNSTNEWEAIYDMPRLTEKEVAEMVGAPSGEECSSDSFYFVEDHLVMHNKARYHYVEGLTMGSGGAGGPAPTAAAATTSSSSSVSSSSSASTSSGGAASSSHAAPAPKAESKGAK